jgi:hypothetical protein
LIELGRMFENRSVNLLVEADTLKTDTGNLQCPSVAESVNLIDVLRREVLSCRNGLLNQIVDRLGKHCEGVRSNDTINSALLAALPIP